MATSNSNNHPATAAWLKALGYASAEGALHVPGSPVDPAHPYASEIQSLLDQTGPVRATAVFDVDGVPTVCFLEGPELLKPDWVDAVRQRIWNQSLVSIVLKVESDGLVPLPLKKNEAPLPRMPLDRASSEGEYSAPEVQSGDIARRLPAWFDPAERVDQELLKNLQATVSLLKDTGLERGAAQFLMGQVLFVSYLEHRGIVSSAYRETYDVKALHELIKAKDRKGLKVLYVSLKETFNGDFLDPKVHPDAHWTKLSDEVLQLLDLFLSRVNMESGQQAMWNYDFRYIPVELLSGIYETFLNEDQEKLGAYYTPRNLANLAVEQVFSRSADPTAETVYDGACGSGILLTTAFRRMLGHAESRRGQALSLEERITLLTGHVFGGDVSEDACRVTAFSLYLSLLENLVPRDISLLTGVNDTKLPNLLGKNILFGEKEGDFFSANNAHASSHRFTCFLSNPPWRESDRGETASFERWAEASHKPLVRRQIAGAFAQRALESLGPDGKLSLILPVSLFLAPTSETFIQHWLAFVKINRIINFGDMRKLLFPTAKHGCVVVVAELRKAVDEGRVFPVDEVFDYWVPKTDVSFAFGRLTIHGSDRHKVQTQRLLQSNSVLRELYWGTPRDRALISKLTATGCLGDMANRPRGGWQFIKGFNVQRRGTKPLPLRHLKDMRFLDTNLIPKDVPFLDRSLLQPFPVDAIPNVVSYGSNDGRAFKGKRVLFPDGTSNALEMRAVYASGDFCFKHTLAAICGGENDEDLLRFVAAYLRSPLVSYILLHTAFSPANERERVTVAEVEALPFSPPNQHRQPARAAEIIKLVADKSRELQAMDIFQRGVNRNSITREINVLVGRYFDLSDEDIALIEETAEFALTSRQPSSYERILTPWQGVASRATLQAYCETMREELQRWRDALGGRGFFGVEIMATGAASKGAWGIVKVTIKQSATDGRVQDSLETSAMHATLDELRREGLMPMQTHGNIYLAADFLIHAGNTMYFIKPRVNRLWRRNQAIQDVRQIVESVQDLAEE